MPDWNRIFPDTDHRWIMGLRQGELAEFFTNLDPTGAICEEHVRWLDQDLGKYSAVLPEARPALLESVTLANSLGATIDFTASETEQLKGLAGFWEADIVWMHPDSHGMYRVAGGIVGFPSSWALREKLGRPMSEVHEPVPGLNQALGRQIDTFLTKQIPGAIWRRENWSLARDGNLNHHVSRPRRKLDETITADEVWIRLEHQLLLKFASSGSILFGIHVELIPFQTVLDEPLAAARFARILSTIGESAAAYKGFATARAALLAMLRHAAESASDH